MITQLISLNWLSVLVAFVAYFFLGGIWFAFLFKKQYAISLGKENNLPAKPAPLFIIGPAICSLIITIATAVLFYALGINSYSQAIEFGLMVGIGFLVANTFNIAINPNMPYPLHYGIISGVYHLVGILMVCIILVAMK
jgi:uncharacterized membrane protein